MDKKKQNILIEYNLWLVLAVIVALGFIVYIVRYDEPFWFDPEKDICEIRQLNSDKHQILTNDEYETYLKLNHPFIYDFNGNVQWHCSEWRLKNKCELNPNDKENCVCDEYNDNVVGSWKQCFGETCIEGDIILINEARVMTNRHSNCAKAHDKNECERGNSRWMWDRDIYGDECDTKIMNETSILCLVCRRKTLRDLDCDELKEEYLKEENDYCPWGQFWFVCFGQWGNRYGSKEGILMEYMGRCYG